jgi:hypothetical protein
LTRRFGTPTIPRTLDFLAPFGRQSISILGTAPMARSLRIAAYCTLGLTLCLLPVLGGMYYAARQVRPFYENALHIEPEVLERGSRELESRATALYSDARKAGQWQAVFTAEQINGWLAVQLVDNLDAELPSRIRDPRVAISPDMVTLGFRMSSGGVDTVVSVDAGVFLTDEGAVAVRFASVRAGALPLPVMQLADEIADACQELSLPVRWTRQDSQPVAIVELHSDASTDTRQFFMDAIELHDGELYVAGHTTEVVANRNSPLDVALLPGSDRCDVALDEFELRFTPRDERSALEVARRPDARDKKYAKRKGG